MMNQFGPAMGRKRLAKVLHTLVVYKDTNFFIEAMATLSGVVSPTIVLRRY
jgi:hypothetical protein